MEELGPGLYEALVTEGLKAQLDSLAERLPSRVRDLRAAEAPDRIAWHLSKQIESALADVGDAERVGVGLTVARALLDRLGELVASTPRPFPQIPPRSCTRCYAVCPTADRRRSTNRSSRCSTPRS
jgi:hypothetical protein